MTEASDDWSAAPKDGSEINVQFPDGTRARVRWNIADDKWEALLKTGEWGSMQYIYGKQNPVVWWQ